MLLCATAFFTKRTDVAENLFPFAERFMITASIFTLSYIEHEFKMFAIDCVSNNSSFLSLFNETFDTSEKLYIK